MRNRDAIAFPVSNRWRLRGRDATASSAPISYRLSGTEMLPLLRYRLAIAYPVPNRWRLRGRQAIATPVPIRWSFREQSR